MRRRELMGGESFRPYDPWVKLIAPDSPVPIMKAKPGDALTFYSNKLWICESLAIYGTKIGAVIVPPSHNLYGDGSGCVAALDNVTLSDGTEKLEFGAYTADGLPTEYPTLLCCQALDNLGSFSNLTYASSDIKLGTDETPIGSTQAYRQNFGCLNGVFAYDYVPYYPFNADGSKNKLTKYSPDFNNALSDIDGYSNTQKIYDISFKWDKEIADTELAQLSLCFPAILFARKYHTIGTNETDWYLPSMGEMSYIVASIEKYRELSSDNMYNGNYWTSTIQGPGYYDKLVWILELLINNASRYNVSTLGMQDKAIIKPFMRIGQL